MLWWHIKVMSSSEILIYSITVCHFTVKTQGCAAKCNLIKKNFERIWVKTLCSLILNYRDPTACCWQGGFSSFHRKNVKYSSIHYGDVIMGAIASQITSLTIVYSTVYSDADQSKHQSSASLAFVWGIHRGPVNSLHKWPVTRKMFPFDDVIM